MNRIGPNVGRVGVDENPVASWYNSLPSVTKGWWTLSFLFANMVYFGWVPPESICWSWHHLAWKWQLWRIVTPFCFVGTWGPKGFSTLISLYMLQQYSKGLESGAPNTGGGGNVSDYIVLVFLSMVGHIIISATVYPRYFMGESLMFTVLYIWCKLNQETSVSLWGFKMQANIFPFALMALHLATGSDFMADLIGLVVGHIYYFLQGVYPNIYGKDIIHTPDFVIALCYRFKIGSGYINSAAPVNNSSRGIPPPGRVRPPSGGGYDWGGGGRSLGSS